MAAVKIGLRVFESSILKRKKEKVKGNYYYYYYYYFIISTIIIIKIKEKQNGTKGEIRNA